MSDSKPDDASVALTHGRGYVFVRLTLVLYLLLLGGFALWSGNPSADWDFLKWTPDTPNWILQTAGQLAARATRDFLLIFPLAFLLAAACRRPSENRRWIDTAFAVAVGWGLAMMIGLLLTSVMAGSPIHLPSVVGIALVAVFCMAGSWAGATWIRSRGSASWILFQLFSLTCFLVAAGFSIAWFGLGTQPLEISTTPLSAEDRIRLVKTFRRHDPRKLSPDKTTELSLTQRDLNQLLSWGFSLLPGEQQGAMTIAPDRVTLLLTGTVPSIPVFGNVINVHLSGQPITMNGELGLQPLELSVGRIVVPSWLLKLGGPVMIDKDWQQEANRPFFSALKQIRVEDGQVAVAYGHIELPDGFVHDTLVGIGAIDEIAAAVAAHTTALMQLAQEHERLTFGQCFETVFANAKARSNDPNASPIHENRAAIVSLGYAFGHPGIRNLLGSEVPALPPNVIRKFRAVPLRGRTDWTRHYTLSAALEVLSNKLASRAIGVLKEELDSSGGSGFSFADLLADRAGTQLAISATISDEAALAMQLRVAAGFVMDDFMPEGQDLPEGIQRDVFVKQFGGVNDARYQEMLSEIDHRISRCSALNPIP